MAIPTLRGSSGTTTSHQIMSAPNLGLELPSPSALNPQTNELLHHYTTTLYASLAADCPHTVWCVTIPQLGLEHPFVFSAILALSALQLASMVPQRRQELHILALAQASSALPSFRTLMRRPKPENIHALFAFAASTVYYIMASPGQVDRCRLPSRNDEYPHWFQTMRGFMAWVGNHWVPLAEGPLGLLIHRKDNHQNHALKNPNDEQFAKLQGMFSSDRLSSNQLSERSVETCKEALEDLRQVAGLSYSSSPSVKSVAAGWVGQVSQEFVELVYERDPRALVILAHYCVVLKRQDHVWYQEGLGAGLLENIRQALAEEWLPWIEWAREQPVSTNQ
ncbi:hypothetical protein EG329_001281 [Mollisiaceae sp. DMI_Dod_QoI]|nr:hypothetical protein EG329_001281 [Helotiales sp. DMI_Dod_QoI]